MNSVSGEQTIQAIDLRIFEATPGIRVLLLPNAPVYTYVAVSNDFVLSTGMSKEDVIGKGHFEIFPENIDDLNSTGEANLRKSFDYIVRQKKSQQLPLQRYDIPVGNGLFSEKYWKINNAPVVNEEGEVLYIIYSAEDVTPEVTAEKNETEYLDIEKAHHLFMQAPVIIGIVKGDDNIIELANKELLAIWGKGPEVIGQPLFTAIPELEGQGFREHLDNVRKSGVAYYAYEDPLTLVKNGKEEVRYIDFTYQPYYKDGSDTIATGVFAVGHDVTERIAARSKIEENEEKYRTIFLSMDQGFCILEMIFDRESKPYDYRFIETNPVFESLTGLKNAKGRRALELVPNLEKKWFELYGNVALTGEPIRFTEGSEAMGKWFDVSAFKIGGEDSKRVALLFTNISEQKKSDEAIILQNELIRTIADNATSTLFMMDANGYCTFVNSSGEKMFGYTLDELKEKPLHYLIHHHRPDGSFYPMEECPLDRALPENFDVRAHRDLFFKKDGTSIPVSCAASPIFENGVPVSTVIEVRDITLEIEAEHALRRSAAELEQKVLERTNELKQTNNQLKQFTYAASHDLQEPLRKISFFTDQLVSSIGPSINDDNKRLVSRIQHTSARMRHLISDLLDYSNTSLGTLGFKEVDLDSIVKEVLEDMEASVIEKNAIIDFKDLPLLNGDYRQLRQMFQNLISNAIKYSKKGEAPYIEIRSKRVTGKEVAEHINMEQIESTFYEIQLQDNGIGFDQEDATKIFGLFQRLHGRTEYEGTGLGLAIVQKVVENHDGFIRAESKKDKGALFTVLLPVT